MRYLIAETRRGVCHRGVVDVVEAAAAAVWCGVMVESARTRPRHTRARRGKQKIILFLFFSNSSEYFNYVSKR